jgi:GNAT superfamily N-acetyltransferase
VELPYTLPQDFLLFVLMQEKNIDIWKKKLDWIADQGGMALFITHPNYMNFNFNNTPSYDEYPVKYYEEFLEYIKSKYEGQYWHALPRDVARFWAGKNKVPTPAPPNPQSPFRAASRMEGARRADCTAMMIDVIIKKARRNLNDFGVRGLLTKGLQYLLKTFYVRRTYRVYRIDLSAERFPEKAPEGVLIRLIDTGDTDAISQIENIEEWLRGKVLGILSHGLCVVAFDGPRVIGFNLVVFRDAYIPLLNLRKSLRPHQAWSEQITVLKTYRKQELASALRYRVFSELWKRGIRTFYGGTLTSNMPSLRLAAKVGFQTIADVRYLKILNRERRRWRKIRHDSC